MVESAMAASWPRAMKRSAREKRALGQAESIKKSSRERSRLREGELVAVGAAISMRPWPQACAMQGRLR